MNKDIKNVVQLVKNKDNGYIEPKDFTFEQVFSKIDAVGTDIHPNIEFKIPKSILIMLLYLSNILILYHKKLEDYHILLWPKKIRLIQL